MYFKRNLSSQLSVWQRNPTKKPLLLKGVRKVGKTSLTKEWGATKYEDIAYFDLSNTNSWNEIFSNEAEPDYVLEKLATIRCRNFHSKSTLIILDNLDYCPNALSYLHRFNNLASKLSIIGISSYFEFLSQNFNDNYFKNITIKTLHPLTFKEYLEKTSQFGKASYSHYVGRDHIKSIKNKFFNILESKYQDFLVSGGFPEPAKVYHESKSKSATHQVQQNIINSIESDFLKLTTGVLPKRIHEVWRTVMGNNLKGDFKFSSIDNNSRRREYQEAINWLKLAGLIFEIKSDTKSKYIPIDTVFVNAISNHNEPKFKNLWYLYALGCMCRKYPIVNIVDNIIHIENKSNRIPVQCMTNTGVKRFKSTDNDSLLVHLRLCDSKLTENVLQLPVFFVDEIAKFNRTAMNQLSKNYFPKKKTADFY